MVSGFMRFLAILNFIREKNLSMLIKVTYVSRNYTYVKHRQHWTYRVHQFRAVRFNFILLWCSQGDWNLILHRRYESWLQVFYWELFFLTKITTKLAICICEFFNNLINGVRLRPYVEAVSQLVRNILAFYGNRRINTVSSRACLWSTLEPDNVVHILISFCCKINCNIYVQSVPWSLKWYYTLRYPDHNSTFISYLY
jgi:hypothetical protein